ncbi:hypothetical protein HK23_08880 [Acetobacter malorum]|uniref:Uncharacterized protein n=1 Tax=Acetobacter malorum TaxID=178901 RepID=A0A1Y3G3Y8_9PROT|nr:hypothetical protein HK23_08880 [Acetobacter malorum]
MLSYGKNGLKDCPLFLPALRSGWQERLPAFSYGLQKWRMYRCLRGTYSYASHKGMAGLDACVPEWFRCPDILGFSRFCPVHIPHKNQKD